LFPKLHLRRPNFVKEINLLRRKGKINNLKPRVMSTETDKKLFTPFTFKSGVSVKNRIAMAPMTTWSSNDDATISDDEVAHYKVRTQGVGFVITGCSRVLANGQGFTDEYASFDDKFIPSLKKLADAAKSGGAKAIMQIYHAGNKAIAELLPEWDLVSASAVAAGAQPFLKGDTVPRALSHLEIVQIIKAFGQTTRRAIEAGFDGIELHGAHGFLLQNFFSPYFNQRTDQWGGSAEKRMSFPLEVVREVKRVIALHARSPFILGYRISPEESQDAGLRITDAMELIDRLIELDVDYIHISLTNVLESTPIGDQTGKTIAQLIIDHVNGRIPLIAAGHIRTPLQAGEAIAQGLSMVAVGQGLIMNPDWVELALKGQEVQQVLHSSKMDELHIPKKLLGIIDLAKGWFPVVEDGIKLV
jgi:2,4-dienoyl-CoA reductase-like NADH-dependent reductase (Old Yellow Enzyme family)